MATRARAATAAQDHTTIAAGAVAQETTLGAEKIGAQGTARGDVVGDPAAAAATDLWIAPNHPWYDWDAIPTFRMPWNHFTHLGLGSLQPVVSNGQYTVAAPSGWWDTWEGFRTRAAGFANAGHTGAKKVFMMLGEAQSNTGEYAGIWNAATSPPNIDAFADNVVAALKDMHLDGVEIDWEEDIDYGQLVAFAQKIRARWPDGLIFVDVMPLDDGSFAALAPAKDAIDAFMPMTFLPIPQWGGWVLPIPLTPLYGYPGNGYSVDDNLKAWALAGVPASKVIMGVGGFGSVWGDSNGDHTGPVAPYITVNGDGGANGETGSLYDDNVVTWSWVKDLVQGAGGRMIEEWDDLGKCSYWRAPATNELVTATVNSRPVEASLVFYETPRSVTEKVSYANARGMRGMNFWTLKQLIDGATSPILQAAMR